MSEISEVKNEKSEDKKDIEMEEREKMLNAENKAQCQTQDLQGAKQMEIENEEKKISKEMKEGMEVKPKKIPIGGIQMPGFFTRSKSKERCKEDSDQNEAEGAELIDKNTDSTDNTQTRIKLPNPFRKSKIEEDGNKTTDTKEKKTFLDTIKLPLVSVLPKKKKDESLGQHPSQAGLASMETLDGKSTDDKNGDDLKNVPLDDKTDVEQQVETKGPETWGDKLRLYRSAICALFLFVIVAIIIVAISIPRQRIEVTPPIRDGRYIETITGCGKVEGQVVEGAFAFYGIPYARPPVGELRFKYAQSLNSLDYCWNGTYLAHNETDVCLQILGNGTVVGKEDCLTLDIITPVVRYDNPLPVVVLVGADSLMGGSPGKLIPSMALSKNKEVVFVRPNFRMGALGFLALNILSRADYPNSSGNYGLSDILEALKWVQINIDHFGGDPNSVTLVGHRAGATLVTALSTVTNAAKLFSRVWATSGSAIYPNRSLMESELDNKSFLEAVQCENVECLKNMDAVKLITSVEDTWRKPQVDLPQKGEPTKRHEWLVLDGRILKENPESVWNNTEKPLPVPLVLGTTAQAGSSEKLLMKHAEWSELLIKEHINNSFISDKGFVDDILKMYPATYKGLASLITDIRITCPLFTIMSQMRDVPFYVAIQPRGEQSIADIDADIEAILGRYDAKTPQQIRYVSGIQDLFYGYVWHGKIEQEMFGMRVLLVGPDVLPNSTYSHCAYWLGQNIIYYGMMD